MVVKLLSYRRTPGRGLRNGDVLLSVCLFVCLQKRVLASPGRLAATNGVTDGSSPAKNFTPPVKFMLAAGAYSWRQ